MDFWEHDIHNADFTTLHCNLCKLYFKWRGQSKNRILMVFLNLWIKIIHNLQGVEILGNYNLKSLTLKCLLIMG